MKTFNCLFAIPTLFLFASCQQIADKSDFNVERENLITQENQTDVREYEKESLSIEESDRVQADYESGIITDLSEYDFYRPIGLRCDTVGKTPEEKVNLEMQRVMLSATYYENDRLVIKRTEDELMAEGKVTVEFYEDYLEGINRVNSQIENGSSLFINPQTGRYIIYNCNGAGVLPILKIIK